MKPSPPAVVPPVPCESGAPCRGPQPPTVVDPVRPSWRHARACSSLVPASDRVSGRPRGETRSAGAALLVLVFKAGAGGGETLRWTRAQLKVVLSVPVRSPIPRRRCHGLNPVGFLRRVWVARVWSTLVRLAALTPPKPCGGACFESRWTVLAAWPCEVRCLGPGPRWRGWETRLMKERRLTRYTHKCRHADPQREIRLLQKSFGSEIPLCCSASGAPGRGGCQPCRSSSSPSTSRGRARTRLSLPAE